MHWFFKLYVAIVYSFFGIKIYILINFRYKLLIRGVMDSICLAERIGGAMFSDDGMTFRGGSVGALQFKALINSILEWSKS